MMNIVVQDTFSGVASLHLAYRFDAGDTSWNFIDTPFPEEILVVMIPWDNAATALIWYAQVWDCAGHMTRYPQTGVDTVIRVSVDEKISSQGKRFNLRLLPGEGLRYDVRGIHSLEVYDVMGRRIRRITLPPSGQRTLQIGQPGVYFLRIRPTGRVQARRKVVVIR